MWQAVLAQVFLDATEPLPLFTTNFRQWVKRRRRWVSSRKREPESEIAERAAFMSRESINNSAKAWHRYRQATSRDWLLMDRDDFHWVCTAAGRDPNRVRDRARELESAGWPELKGEGDDQET